MGTCNWLSTPWLAGSGSRRRRGGRNLTAILRPEQRHREDRDHDDGIPDQARGGFPGEQDFTGGRWLPVRRRPETWRSGTWCNHTGPV
jgi:hypothetical protein